MRVKIAKHLFLPVIIWLSTISFMMFAKYVATPIIDHFTANLDHTYSEVILYLRSILQIWCFVAQISIVSIATAIATRKFDLTAKSLLVIIPITYLLFALYAPHGWYMLVYTGTVHWFFSTFPAMPYWYASIFISLQYGFVMLCAIAATRAKMYPDKDNENVSKPVSEILYCCYERESILKGNLSVARYNRYLDRMSRYAKKLDKEKRLSELLPYLKDESISVRFDIATLLFSHYKNECTGVLLEIAEMTEEKGLPKHLASLPESAEKLASNDFFGEVNAYETGF